MDKRSSEGALQLSPIVNVTVRTDFPVAAHIQHERVGAVSGRSDDDGAEGLRQRKQLLVEELQSPEPPSGLGPGRTRSVGSVWRLPLRSLKKPQ